MDGVLNDISPKCRRIRLPPSFHLEMILLLSSRQMYPLFLWWNPLLMHPLKHPPVAPAESRKGMLPTGVKKTFPHIYPGRTATTNPLPMSLDGPRPER